MSFLNKIFSGARRVFKTTAQKIKRVGGQLAGKLGSVATSLTKTGPLAAMGTSLIPGIGEFFSDMWTTTGARTGEWASSSNLLVRSVGTAGQSVYDGANWLKGSAGSITDGISGAIQSIGGGNTDEGMELLSGELKEVVTGTAGDKAIASGREAIRKIEAQKFLDANPELLKAGAPARQIARSQSDLIIQANELQQETPGLSRARALAQAQGLSIPGTSSQLKKTRSLAERALGAAATFFESGAQASAPMIPDVPDAPQQIRTGQLGSVGQAATGGNFLSEDMLGAYRSYWGNALGVGKRVGGTV